MKELMRLDICLRSVDQINWCHKLLAKNKARNNLLRKVHFLEVIGFNVPTLPIPLQSVTHSIEQIRPTCPTNLYVWNII